MRELADPALRLVKLVAPAGYGKSTLAKDVLEQYAAVARVDVGAVGSRLDVARAFLEACASLAPAAERAELSRHLLALGDDDAAIVELAVSTLRAAAPDVVVHLENAERLAPVEDAVQLVERILPALPARARVIVCSRVNIIRSSAFAGPDRTAILTADDLRFTTDEIHRIFANIGTRSNEVEAIAHFTRGWPIVVMMLFMLARRGRLDAYLREDTDIADLYGYLASEVYASLEPEAARVIDALASFPRLSFSELEALFSDAGTSVAYLLQQTPFVAQSDGHLELHPAMRQMLAPRVDTDRYRGALFARLAERDDCERAAEIAMLRNRPADAAAVLARNLQGTDFWTFRTSNVINSLPERIFYSYPELWLTAVFERASHDVVHTIRVGEHILEHLDANASPHLRASLISGLLQLLVNRGRMDRARHLTNQLLHDPAFAAYPEAARLADFWTYIIASYRGDPIDISRLWTDFADLGASPVQQSWREMIAVAGYYRMHGQKDLDRAAVARGLEIGRGIDAPLVRCVNATYAAMSAWFWGDNDLFDRSVDELDESVTPFLRTGFGHFLSCCRRADAELKEGSEKLDMRTYAYLIAAARTERTPDRRRLLRAALLAGQQSAQRFCEALAAIVTAVCDDSTRDEQLDRAAQLAREMESAELQRAVAALRSGHPEGTMLERLVRRFSPSHAQRRLRLDERKRTVWLDDDGYVLARREYELLALLCSARGSLAADSIATALWPQSGVDQALTSLRVTVNRLRRRLGDASVIRATGNGYSIEAEVTLEAATPAGTTL